MSDATFTFQVDDTLKYRFIQAAKSHNQNDAQLPRDFMQEYVQNQDTTAYDIWFKHQVEIGIGEANAGDVISAEEAEAEAQQWRIEIQRKRDASNG